VAGYFTYPVIAITPAQLGWASLPDPRKFHRPRQDQQNSGWFTYPVIAITPAQLGWAVLPDPQRFVLNRRNFQSGDPPSGSGAVFYPFIVQGYIFT
jgi:hypothetical protein